MSSDDADEIDSLEAQVATALAERLPQLHSFFVCPYVAQCDDADVWVVARDKFAVMFISLETERFGVGFVDELGTVFNADEYPTAELAAPAFLAAVTNGP